MSTTLYIHEQDNPTFLDEKDTKALAQWLFDITESRALFDAALRSNLRGLHLLRRWQSGGEERLVECLTAGLGVHDPEMLEDIVDAVVGAADDIDDARDDARLVALRRRWVDELRLLQSNNRAYPAISVRGGGLGDEGLALLADPLASNRVVTSLDLAGSGLRGCGAGLVALARALRQNEALRDLDLSDNELQSEGARELFAVLRTDSALRPNRTLRRLRLRNNRLGSMSALARAAAGKRQAAITRGADLSKLPVGRGAAGEQEDTRDSGVLAVAKVVEFCANNRKHCKLALLDLWGNCLGPAGAALMAEALRSNENLTALDLGSNDLGDVGLLALFGAFVPPQTAREREEQLRQLHGARGGGADEPADAKEEVADAAATAAATAATAAVAVATADDCDAKALVPARRAASAVDDEPPARRHHPTAAPAPQPAFNSTLVALDLCNSWEGAGPFEMVAHMLRCTPLQVQRVADGGGDGGGGGGGGGGGSPNRAVAKARAAAAAAVAKAGPKLLLPHLTSLGLAGNRGGAAGVAALTAALGGASARRRSAQSLTSLDLGNNEIGDEGAEHVAALLTEQRLTSSLTHIDLSHNHIADAGAIALAGALAATRVLARLDVAHNMIGPAGGETIAEAMALRRAPGAARVGGLQLRLAHNSIGLKAGNSLTVAARRRGSGAGAKESDPADETLIGFNYEFA